MMNIQKAWWELTGCGNKFCSDVIQALKGSDSVVIQGSAALPWTDLLFDRLKSAGVSSTKAFDVIKPPAGCDPAEYLFNTYCSYSVQSKYWPQPPEYTHVNFLAEIDDTLLNQRFLVVNSFASENDFLKWYKFVDRYCGLVKASGVDKSRRAAFILEYTGHPPCTVIYQQVKNIPFCPRDVDLLTYNLLNTSSDGIRYISNQYAAELVGELCHGNIEQCGLLAGRKGLITDPIAVYKEFTQQTAASAALSEQQIRSAVSLAQLKVFFPLVEQKRREITEKYYSAITALLPWENDYKEKKIEPYDMELRDLLYKAREMDMESPDKELVIRLRDIRNDLAHNHILSSADVNFLISL